MKINRIILNKAIPHFAAIIVFLIISGIYFSPQLERYLINQSDIANHIGMSKEIADFRAKYNAKPLWTNSTFGAMPAYQISTKNTNVINSLKNNLLLKFFKANYALRAMIIPKGNHIIEFKFEPESYI